MPFEAFLMGYSVKLNENAIGQYGEGLKLAMLVLTRLGHEFSFISGPFEYRFSFESPSSIDNGSTVYLGVSTLHVERLDLNATIEPTTVIAIYDILKEYIDNVYTDLPVNTMIPKLGGIYCQGLLVDKSFFLEVNGIRYGINLNAGIESNRDRNYFLNYKLITPVIEKYFKPSQMFKVNSSMSESTIFKNFSPEYKQEVAKAHFLRNHSTYKYEDLKNITVLIPMTSGRFGRTPGYVVATDWYHGYYLMSDKEYDILNSLRINDDEQEDTGRTDSYIEKLRIQRMTTQLEDFSLSTNVYELIQTMVQYIPNLKKNREKYSNEVCRMAKSLLEGKEIVFDNKIFGSTEDED